MVDYKEILRLSDNFFEVGRMTASLEKKAHTYGTEHLLYSNEVHTLKIIAVNEGINQKELTNLMMRTKGATSLVLDKLVAKGLVEKRESQKDMRIYKLYLTDAGHKVNEQHNEYDITTLKKWVKDADISDEEITATNQTIEKIINYYRKAYLSEE